MQSGNFYFMILISSPTPHLSLQSLQGKYVSVQFKVDLGTPNLLGGVFKHPNTYLSFLPFLPFGLTFHFLFQSIGVTSS